MELLLGLIVGLVAWHTVTFIVCLVSDQNEDVTALCGMGIWSLLCFVFGRLVGAILTAFKHARYKAILIDSDKRYCYCNSKEADDYIEKSYNFARDIADRYTPADGWRKRDCVCGHVNLRYCPMKVIKEVGAYKLKKGLDKQAPM